MNRDLLNKELEYLMGDSSSDRRLQYEQLKVPKIIRRSDPSGIGKILNEQGQPAMRDPNTAIADPRVLLEIVDRLQVEKSKKYQRNRDGQTFCNIYVQDYCRFAGAYLKPQNANDTFDWLRAHGAKYGWEKMSKSNYCTEIQSLANEGHVVVFTLKRPTSKHGHMFIIIPESPRARAERENGTNEVITPVHSQAGSENVMYSNSYGKNIYFKPWKNKIDNYEIFVKRLKPQGWMSFVQSNLGIQNNSSSAVTTTSTTASIPAWRLLSLSTYAANLIKKGEKDANAITNAVFYNLHPEKAQKNLTKEDPLVPVWIQIKKQIVMPLLNNTKGVNRKKPIYQVNYSIIKRIEEDTEIQDSFQIASKITEIPVLFLKVFSYIESGGNKKIGTNPYGYTGLMQVGRKATNDVIKNFPEAAASYGISWANVIESVKVNVITAAFYLRLNMRWLPSDIPKDVLHLYLAHQQGASGLKKIMQYLKESPNKALERNQLLNLPKSIIASKGGKSNVTIMDFYNHYKIRIGTISQAFKEY